MLTHAIPRALEILLWHKRSRVSFDVFPANLFGNLVLLREALDFKRGLRRHFRSLCFFVFFPSFCLKCQRHICEVEMTATFLSIHHSVICHFL